MLLFYRAPGPALGSKFRFFTLGMESSKKFVEVLKFFNDILERFFMYEYNTKIECLRI